jgi:phosphotriesterase-related protein
MWDPNRYVDTDFGLTPDERFEPDEDGQPIGSLEGQAHIMTVLGPIAPEDLGVCQHAEYLLHGPGTNPDAPAVRTAADELEAYFTVGGRSMVDISLGNPPRNVRGLRTLAQLVPVHIVAATGGGLARESTLAEIEHGIDGTGIRPGIVVSTTVTEMQTSAEVANATGLPHLVLFGSGNQAPDLASRIEAAGADPKRTLVSLPGASLETCLRILDRGAWVSLDRIGDENDDRIAALVVELVAAGFGERVLLSQRLAGPASYVTRGGQPGWIHILERFVLDLMSAGLSGDHVRAILIDNQSRALTIPPWPGQAEAPGA